jgi:hypothetical protein
MIPKPNYSWSEVVKLLEDNLKYLDKKSNDIMHDHEKDIIKEKFKEAVRSIEEKHGRIIR